MKGKKCYIVLSALFIIFGLSLNVYSDVNASFGARTLTSHMGLYNPNTNEWVNIGFNSYGGISSGWVANRMTLSNTTSQLMSFTAGDTVIVSGTLLTLFDYTSGSTNAPVTMTCPQFYDSTYFSTIECEIDSNGDVSSGQHFQTINYVAKGYVNTSINTNQLVMSIMFRNNHAQGIRVYGLSPVISSNAGTSTDVSALLQQISSSNQSILSAIQSFNSDITTILPAIESNIINAIRNNSNSTTINSINENIESMQEQDEEDRENIEQQASDNQDQADDAGDEADQTGQTLMQAFGSLITALTSIQETNCKLPNMSVYSLNLNNIDLCAVSLPSGIAALMSIGMVLIIVPLGINLVKRMINLYKEIVG